MNFAKRGYKKGEIVSTLHQKVLTLSHVNL